MLQINNKDVSPSFLNRSGNLYDWPSDEDHSWQPIDDSIYTIPTPDVVNNRGQLTFPANSLEEARNLALNMTEITINYLK